MNTQSDHARVRIKTYIENYQSGCGCVPGQQSNKALSRSEVSARLRNNFKHVIEQNKIDHAWQLNQTNNQSIIRKSHYVGPLPKPDLYGMN